MLALVPPPMVGEWVGKDDPRQYPPPSTKILNPLTTSQLSNILRNDSDRTCSRHECAMPPPPPHRRVPSPPRRPRRRPRPSRDGNPRHRTSTTSTSTSIGRSMDRRTSSKCQTAEARDTCSMPAWAVANNRANLCPVPVGCGCAHHHHHPSSSLSLPSSTRRHSRRRHWVENFRSFHRRRRCRRRHKGRTPPPTRPSCEYSNHVERCSLDPPSVPIVGVSPPVASVLRLYHDRGGDIHRRRHHRPPPPPPRRHRPIGRVDRRRRHRPRCMRTSGNAAEGLGSESGRETVPSLTRPRGTSSGDPRLRQRHRRRALSPCRRTRMPRRRMDVTPKRPRSTRRTTTMTMTTTTTTWPPRRRRPRAYRTNRARRRSASSERRHIATIRDVRNTTSRHRGVGRRG